MPLAPASLVPASLAPASIALDASLAPASLAPASLVPASLVPASIALDASLVPASLALDASLAPASLAPVFIPKDTMMRLLKDVREMMTTQVPGMHYKHSETDMLCGYALIVGPEDSLYDGGYYFYKFKFPPDYPHSPPLVEFLTNDGTTRMHPNMYKNRKMCLSILNSWRGDQWTGCQTIKSVLLTIMSLLDSKPLLNEPGITEHNADFGTYHRIIQYKNYEFSMMQLLKSLSEFKQVIADIEYHEQFYEHMCAAFCASHLRHSPAIDALLLKHPHSEMLRTTHVYQMNVVVNYPALKTAFQAAVKRLVGMRQNIERV